MIGNSKSNHFGVNMEEAGGFPLLLRALELRLGDALQQDNLSYNRMRRWVDPGTVKADGARHSSDRLSESFVVSIIGNSKSNHVSAQGTFNP